MTKTYAMLAALLLAFGLGLGLGWKIYHPKPLPPSANAAKPEIKLTDGGVVLERKVALGEQHQQEIPKGDVVEHQGTIIVTPAPSAGETPPTAGSVLVVGAPQVSLSPCPPVVIRWSLVTEPDGGQRLIVKSDSGTVIGGDDEIVRPAGPVNKPLVWVAGASRYVRERTYGVWVSRQVGPFVVGGEVKQSRADFGSGKTSADMVLRVGITF